MGILMTIIVMGVSGSGKTTVGRRLADALGGSFHDGDDFHPPENVRKMASGQPLTDADRWPWLKAIRSFIEARTREDDVTVIACSALKQSYRDVLSGDEEDLVWIFLRGDYELIRERMEARSDHFFDADLLQSQFDALEAPGEEEAIVVDVDATPDAIAEEIMEQLPESLVRRRD